ncbi:MAG: methyltransferase domain-containing protein, partial [Mycobacteriales bacterium]
DILAAAPESPWGFPVELFRVPEQSPDTPSRRRALETLPAGGDVLDVGCGGGAGALALVPPASRVTGIDASAAMLREFAAAAERRGVEHTEIEGSWPAAAAAAPIADVVVCHHVAYNVADLAEFATALAGHARRRVVLELSARHPLVATAALWRRFHNLARPEGPSAELAIEVLAGAGIQVREERFLRAPREVPREVLVAFTRRRLCLPASRDGEVDEALGQVGEVVPRELVTLWWDVAVA